MTQAAKATFVISWAQTEADSCQPAGPAMMMAGIPWRWLGEAMRVDAARDVLLLQNALGMEAIRARAARMVGRLTTPSVPWQQWQARASQARARSAAFLSDPKGRPASLTVTDGRQSWTAMILRGAGDRPAADPAQWLLAFEGAMPPVGRELWVVQFRPGPAPEPARKGVICFTSGTKILTPKGQMPVEALMPGDLVLTRDNGAQEVIWTGSRHLSGARLHAMPHLRPVRICDGALEPRSGKRSGRAGRPDGDLLVSPAHRILMQGRAAQALFGSDEVLVRAGDLIDDRRIRTDLTLREVTYHHILLARHEILFANGVGADSFHPDEAALDAASLATLPEAARTGVYGDFARRGLTPAEAALFLHEARG